MVCLPVTHATWKHEPQPIQVTIRAAILRLPSQGLAQRKQIVDMIARQLIRNELADAARYFCILNQKLARKIKCFRW